MKTRKINPAHPGRVLKQEFMEPLGVSNYRLARASGLSQTLIGRIVCGKAGITAPVALRLEAVFGMDAETWLNMQSTYDLLLARQSDGGTTRKAARRIADEIRA